MGTGRAAVTTGGRVAAGGGGGLEAGASQASSGALALLKAGDFPNPAEEEGASGIDRTAGDAGFAGAAGVKGAAGAAGAAGAVGTGRGAPALLIAFMSGAPTGT